MTRASNPSTPVDQMGNDQGPTSPPDTLAPHQFEERSESNET